MRSLFILLILNLGIQATFAQKVKLFGQHAAYANTKIKVLCYEDALSKTEKQLALLQLDEQGRFSVELDLVETQMLILPLGVFRGYFYAEAGRQYQLSLPPRYDLSPAQSLDPFFKPQDLFLGMRNADKQGLNAMIAQFDDKLDDFINQNFEDIYNRRSASLGVEFAKRIEDEFGTVKHRFFQVYKEYRLAYLDYLASPEAYISLENRYFANKKLSLNNPAYTVLFTKIYDDFLASGLNRKANSKLERALASKYPYQELTLVMKFYPAYKDKVFRDILLAKSLFDGAEKGVLTKRKAILILKQVQSNTSDARLTNMTGNYLAKLSHLLKNTPAPDFTVQQIALSGYRGKYLYLNFCNTTSSVWESNFEQIKKLKEVFGEQIEFLSLASDIDPLRFRNRLKQKEFTWPIVRIEEDNSILKDYQIKAFPSYVIIDPEGKVYQYPAMGPQDGVEKVFVKIQREQLRKNYSQSKQ